MSRIEVAVRFDLADPEGERVRQAFFQAGLSVENARAYRAYLFKGDLPANAAERLARDLLTDPVLETFAIGSEIPAPPGSTRRIEILRLSGVTDPVEGSLRKAAKDLGIEFAAVKCIRGAWLSTQAEANELRRAAAKTLANPVVDDVRIDERVISYRWEFPAVAQKRTEVSLLNCSAGELERMSAGKGLALDRAEMLALQGHFRTRGREPTDVELESFAQTWSEHCSHKSFRGVVEYEGKKIDNLLKETIVKATRELDRPWCVSVFADNAGVVRLDDETCLAFKVETHNHPSAIEPYGGSGTGVGGVIRDILGVGLGARPILNLDVFCVGPLDTPETGLPPGVLHPRRVLGGLVAGVRDYGNRMGIPTSAGGLAVHPGYTANPLVFCGTLGVIPYERVAKAPRAGDLIVVAGGRTGRDGIHGATFSSEALTEESETVSIGAVQIGDPITEKRVMDALLAARDRNLFTSVTDCGAGGLSSAVGEMCAKLGAEVDLEKVPLKYAGLTYREIWISESQERMVLAVPPEKWPQLSRVFSAEESEATVIGRFTASGRLLLRLAGETVADLDLDFLHEGCPRRTLPARAWKNRSAAEKAPTSADPALSLRRILASLDIASKEWIVRQYDHEVQGRSRVKPFVGPAHDGPSDAPVIAPLLGNRFGVAVGLGLKVRYGEIDPYRMAASAIDEAVRNVVAVGGDPARTALLDNFCWGDLGDPEQMGGLVEASRACLDTASGLGTPFISGKDSLHNTFDSGGQRTSIPPTLLISALSILDDASRAVTMDLKGSDHPVYLVGLTRREMGGSHYWAVAGGTGGEVPCVDPESSRRIFEALHLAILKGHVLSCHDLSEGGLCIGAAEMAMAGRVGLAIDLASVPVSAGVLRDDEILFSESNGRFLVEVPPERAGAFEMIFAVAKIPCQRIGATRPDGRLCAVGLGARPVLDEPIEELLKVWQAALPLLMEGTVKKSRADL